MLYVSAVLACPSRVCRTRGRIIRLGADALTRQTVSRPSDLNVPLVLSHEFVGAGPLVARDCHGALVLSLAASSNLRTGMSAGPAECADGLQTQQ